MDILTIVTSALLSVVLTIPSMLVLYHKWIIPKILEGVRVQLPPAIISVVDEKIGDFKVYLDEKIENVKMSTLGKLGGSKRTINIISKFFEEAGITEETVQTAIAKWGEAYVNQTIGKMSKNQEQTTEPFGRISD